MSASDELPRGLWLTTGLVNSGSAGLTFPALGGMSWVITEIDASMWLQAVGQFTAGVPVTSAGATLVYGILNTAVVTTGDASRDTWSWSGQIMAPENNAVSIAISATLSASLGAYINAHAYPV